MDLLESGFPLFPLFQSAWATEDLFTTKKPRQESSNRPKMCMEQLRQLTLENWVRLQPCPHQPLDSQPISQIANFPLPPPSPTDNSRPPSIIQIEKASEPFSKPTAYRSTRAFLEEYHYYFEASYPQFSAHQARTLFNYLAGHARHWYSANIIRSTYVDDPHRVYTAFWAEYKDNDQDTTAKGYRSRSRRLRHLPPTAKIWNPSYPHQLPAMSMKIHLHLLIYGHKPQDFLTIDPYLITISRPDHCTS